MVEVDSLGEAGMAEVDSSLGGGRTVRPPSTTITYSSCLYLSNCNCLLTMRFSDFNASLVGK
jgi:hypothetical protein